MAIKELFQSERPLALVNPRAGNRLDPRFKLTRNSTGTAVGRDRIMRVIPVQQPRFDHSLLTGELLGLLLEPTATNHFTYSEALDNGIWLKTSASVSSNTTIAPTGSQAGDRLSGTNNAQNWFRFSYSGLNLTAGFFTISFYAINNVGIGQTVITVLGTTGGGVVVLNSSYASGFYQNWTRITASFDTGAIGLANLNEVRIEFRTVSGNMTGAESIDLFGLQLEKLPYATSYIPTTNAAVTRSADQLSVDSIPIPTSGSVYIDARAVGVAAGNPLISLANASNQKINLGYESRTETYNSTALLATYNGSAKSSLPLPVPGVTRERNIITYGANNYQHGANTSRYATSLAASVPTGLNRLSIGHDAVDPTKAVPMYLNSLYLWAGEITPAIAEALVRTPLTSINADTYAPTGPAGSLALVINTQGATSGGDKAFVLPASRTATVAATALVVGETYRILTTGTSNFTLAGAGSNTVGAVFVATGTTTGTGTCAFQHDFVVTWGDGTESGLEGTAAEGAAVGLTKTYPVAGIYPVWVSGRMQDLIFNNSASAPDLLKIETWGTGKMLTKPSTMANAFYGCSQLQSIPSTNLPDTSACTSWANAFRGCAKLTGTFPSFNTAAATTFANAWDGCALMTGFPLLDSSNVTSFNSSWRDCASLTSFPLLVSSNVTTFADAWRGCSALTSFPLLNTSSVTSMVRAWYQCSSLTSMPLLNTQNVTNMNSTFFGCTALTSVPLFITAAVTDMAAMFSQCTSLSTVPLFNTAAVATMGQMFNGCTALTSVPLFNTASNTSMALMFSGCAQLTSVPAFNTANVTTLDSCFFACVLLNSIPAFNTSNVTQFKSAFFNCNALSSFPLIDTSKGTSFASTWYGTAISSFPALALNAATGTPASPTPEVVGFYRSWYNCTLLTTFPANMFNTTTCTQFNEAFRNCALTSASIENILVSINTAGTSNGNLGLNSGTNAGASTWTANAVTAYNALIARGWTITRNA